MNHIETSGEWQAIGTHSVRLETPDIVHMRIIGDLGNDQVRHLLGMFEDSSKNNRGLFALIDISKAGRPNLDILKSSDIVEKMRGYRAFVYYKAQFQHRTVLEIVKKVAKAFRLSLHTMPLVAFATDAEAYAWIEQFRTR